VPARCYVGVVLMSRHMSPLNSKREFKLRRSTKVPTTSSQTTVQITTPAPRYSHTITQTTTIQITIPAPSVLCVGLVVRTHSIVENPCSTGFLLVCTTSWTVSRASRHLGSTGGTKSVRRRWYLLGSLGVSLPRVEYHVWSQLRPTIGQETQVC
jgi:hypothetical protein